MTAQVFQLARNLDASILRRRGMSKPYHLTHTQRVENWLGAEGLRQIIDGSKGFYHPIPIANTPGALFAYDGEIYGTIAGGTGFSSLSDLITEATTGGKRQSQVFYKTGTLAVTAAWASLWNVGAYPPAGGAPSAIPGGAVPTNATNGALKQADPGGSDTLHFTTAFAQSSAAPNTLLLYDRIFHASAVQHNTTSAQSVSGTPTRYTSTASKGNFAFLEVTTTLNSTAHNITMNYVDQDGNSTEAAPAVAAVVSSAVTRIPHVPWFIPLNTADTGLRNVTQIQMSAVAGGVSNIVVGHPLAFLPCPVANSMQVIDGINSAFNLEQIQTGACLAFLEIKGVASATTYQGQVIMVSG
jgi:hypothetical protein